MEEIEEFRSIGVLTVEMEAASLFAVSKKRCVQSAAIFRYLMNFTGKSGPDLECPETGSEIL